MTWLFPFFLAAGAAIIAPILLHLRRQPPKTRVDFSSLMFLAATPVVTSTRRRFEQWLLLALRCLILLLLAAMFARPFFVSKDELPVGKGSAVVVLVDRSASMGQGKSWAAAQAKALEWLGKFTPQDAIAMGTVDRVLTRALDFAELAKQSSAERQALASGELQRIGLSHAATHLDSALREAVSWLGEASDATERPAQRRIILISDMQEGAHLEALRGFAWPADVALTCEVIEPADTANLSMSLAATEEDSAAIQATAISPAISNAAAQAPAAGLSVRLTNTRDAPTEAYNLCWQGQEKTPIASGQLPAGATRVLHLPQPSGTDLKPVLLLKGDACEFDNRLYLAPAQPRHISVVCLASLPAPSDTASPMYYLARALQPSPLVQPTLTVVDGASTSTSSSASDAIKAAQWLVLTAEAAKPEQLAEAQRWIERGGQALCAVGDNFAPATLTALLGSSLALVEAEVKNYALLVDVDTRHPLMKPFQDSRLSDFSKVHVWHHRRLSTEAVKAWPGAEVIARFDNGDPAWIAIPRGKGRVVLMLHGWHPHDSQLALSSKFVPLLYGLLAEAGVAFDEPVHFTVGDALPLPREGAVIITAPDGKAQAIASADPKRTVLAEQPGVYQIESALGKRLCAINLAPEESRLATMSLSKLSELGVVLDDGNPVSQATATRDKLRLANAALENQQQYWLIALALLLWVLGLETWIAGRKPSPAAT